MLKCGDVDVDDVDDVDVKSLIFLAGLVGARESRALIEWPNLFDSTSFVK